jgi:regulator of replication initiation timing
MDARELTKTYNDLRNDVIELKKQVDYLTQENEKLRMIVEDLRIDIKMMGGR